MFGQSYQAGLVWLNFISYCLGSRSSPSISTYNIQTDAWLIGIGKLNQPSFLREIFCSIVHCHCCDHLRSFILLPQCFKVLPQNLNQCHSHQPCLGFTTWRQQLVSQKVHSVTGELRGGALWGLDWWGWRWFMMVMMVMIRIMWWWCWCWG